MKRVRHSDRRREDRDGGLLPRPRLSATGIHGARAVRRAVAGLCVTAALLLPSAARSAAPSGVQPAPAHENLTVDDVVRQVLRRNDGVLAARFMEEAARRRARPAGAWDDPMLMAGVSNLPKSFDFKEDMMTMTMIGLSQTIPYSGEKGLQRRAAGKEADAAGEDRRLMEIDAAVAAKIAFFDLFYRNAIVADLERRRDLIEQIVDAAVARLRANQAGQDEVLSAQAELWRLDAMILMAEQQSAAARYALNSLRGADPSTRVVLSAGLPDRDIPSSPDAWIEAAERTYPPLRALAYRSEGYALSADAARRMRWPMLTLSGSYGFRADTEMEKRGDMVSFYASLSLPLFKGRRQADMALSMDAMERGAAAEAVQMRREIQSEILTLHERAVRLSERLDLYRNRIIPTAEDAFRSALSGYAGSRTSFIALLDYAQAIISDAIAANEIANELEMTLSEVERYTWAPDTASGADPR